jgi:syntaxin-binding protein 1
LFCGKLSFFFYYRNKEMAAAAAAAAPSASPALAAASSLKDLVRNRLLHEIVSKARPTAGSYCVMVVDHGGMRILSAALKSYDLSDEGVALVESLEKKRQPLPEMTAIYFITPTDASVSAMLADFAHPTKLYKNAHVFFTSCTLLLGRFSMCEKGRK